MRIIIACAVAIAMNAAGTPAQAEEKKVIFQQGDWTVISSVDPMTDKPSCVGIYKNKFDIQLNANALYLSLRGKGGIAAYTPRFDDNPPDKMRLASDIERKISVVEFKDSSFRQIESAKRVRVRALTVLDTIVDFDVNLNGMSEMQSTLKSEACGTKAAKAK